jgi:hypothetical protein
MLGRKVLGYGQLKVEPSMVTSCHLRHERRWTQPDHDIVRVAQNHGIGNHDAESRRDHYGGILRSHGSMVAALDHE